MLDMNDDRLIATIHYYGFYPFSVNLGGSTRFDDKARADVNETLDRAVDIFSPSGIPVVVGEFGLLGFDKSLDTIQEGEKLKYFEYLTYYAREKGLTTMLWDNGQHLNRMTLKWSDERLRQVMQAGWTGRSSTTSSDTVYLKSGEPVSDAVLLLELNGNSLTAVRSGERLLKEGEDYVLQNDELLLRSVLLSSLVGGHIGDNALLTLSFTGGADWDVHVAVVSKPSAGDASGTTEGLTIPVVFNGDKLATIEAEYEGGGIPGPNDWTPFKEFGFAFAPSYSGDNIMLKRPLLESLQEGRATRLRLHFWSGATANYTIVRKGDIVEGKAGS